MVEHVACMGDRRGACGMLVDRPEGKGIFRGPRYKWEKNFKMDLQEVEWAGMDWIVQAQDGESWQVFMNVVMNLAGKAMANYP
jgi:hypothetical protein